MNGTSNKAEGLQLDRVVFYGRTLLEYVRFFHLDLSQWQKSKILDCPSGAASFVAEANQMGIQAIACDLLFSLDEKVLFEKGQADVQHVIERISTVTQLFNWEFYGGIEGLKEHREIAFQKFADDYAIGLQAGRYIPTQLPKLPFDNQSFDLVLSGHFLFSYSHTLEYSFQLQTILEFYRVCSQEVRIYPIQTNNGKLYPSINNLINDLNTAGIFAEIVNVPWEFQKGSNQMLRLVR